MSPFQNYYAHPDGVLRRFGSGAPGPVWSDVGWGDGWTIGVDEPTVANSGFVGSEASLTADSGDKNFPAGTYYHDMLLSNARILSAGNGTVIERCIIDQPAVTSGSIIETIRLWGGSNITIRNTTIRCRAENRSYRIGAGIKGSGFTAYRVKIEGYTDPIMGVGVNQRSNVDVYASYLHQVQRYDGVFGIVHPSDDESHADTIQLEGNLTQARIWGNVLEAGNTSCVITTENAGTYDEAPRFLDNWFRSTDFIPGAYFNLAKASMTSMAGAQVKRNTFPLGSSPARMFILPAYLTPMSAADGIIATGPDRNVYVSGTSIVPVYNGTTNLTSY